MNKQTREPGRGEDSAVDEREGQLAAGGARESQGERGQWAAVMEMRGLSVRVLGRPN